MGLCRALRVGASDITVLDPSTWDCQPFNFMVTYAWDSYSQYSIPLRHTKHTPTILNTITVEVPVGLICRACLTSKMASTHTALQPRDNGASYLSERGSQGIAISVSFTVLATCSVAARLYTRVGIMKHMEPNDWMILIALVSFHRPSSFPNLTRRT